MFCYWSTEVAPQPVDIGGFWFGVCWLLFWGRVLLGSPGCPGSCSCTPGWPQTLRSICLSNLNAGTKGIYHHYPGSYLCFNLLRFGFWLVFGFQSLLEFVIEILFDFIMFTFWGILCQFWISDFCSSRFSYVLHFLVVSVLALFEVLSFWFFEVFKSYNIFLEFQKSTQHIWILVTPCPSPSLPSYIFTATPTNHKFMKLI